MEPVSEQILVTGMTCASCVNRVEKTLLSLPGMLEAEVNLATEKARLLFDPAQTGLEAILPRIQALGYGAEIPKEQKSILYHVEGMTCAACSSRIEKVLGKMPGVESAKVNLMTEKLNLLYDAKQVSLSQVKERVTQLGFSLSEPQSLDEKNQRHQGEEEKLWRGFLISGAFSLPLMILAMAEMVGVSLPGWISPHHSPLTYGLVQLGLVLPTLWAGQGFFVRGAKNLKALSPNMDSLIALGAGAAVVYSIWNTALVAQGQTQAVMHLYYETAGVILTLILLGKYLETKAKGRTSQAIQGLMKLQTKWATRLVEDQPEMVPTEELQVGDLLLVKPGEQVPVDGIIHQGRSSLDESSLTGESLPVDKAEGDQVTGGSINQLGLLQVRATAVGSNTLLSRMIKMVEEAQGRKAPIAGLADRIAGVFVPVVIVLALGAGLAWWISGAEFDFVLKIIISVLVIACPCALGLATPTAIMVGTGRGAGLGILIKGGEALEGASHIQQVVFDKTGTLTKGQLEVTQVIPLGTWDQTKLLQWAAAAEKGSEHLVAKALIQAGQAAGVAPLALESFLVKPGLGIQVGLEGRQILLGNAPLLQEAGVDLAPAQSWLELEQKGQSLVYLACDSQLAGIFALGDQLKPDSRQAVAALEAMGIECIMLTGDRQATAQAIAAQAGIKRVIAQVLPHQKAEMIQSLQQKGKKVAMVGDGINDAAALAQADLGVALGSGTDIAMESARVVLMKESLQGVVAALKLSRATMNNIRQNLFWAFFYNCLGIPLAAGVFLALGGPGLNPMVAAAAMALSSVSVVTNALRLKAFKA